MSTVAWAGAGKGWFWLPLLLLALGLAACEEDEPEYVATLSGDGSIESPYIIQFNQHYQALPIAPAGAAFFLAEKVPAGWSAVQIASAVDVDLSVSGFDSTLQSDSGGGSFTPGVGTESYLALADGVKTDLFFTALATQVRTGNAAFDVSVVASEAPAPQMRSMCAFCTQPVYTQDFRFVMADAAPLSVTLSNTSGQFMHARAFDRNSNPISFAGNSGFGASYCTVNYTGSAPFSGGTATCSILPTTGAFGLDRFELFNGTGTPGDLTVSISSP